MKTVLFAISLLTASASFAGTLTCWDTYKKDSPVLMTAHVENFNVLTNAQFASSDDQYQPQSASPRMVAELLQSKRSPYAGYNQFTLKNGSVLILPTDLSQANLVDIGNGYFSEYDKSGSGVNAIIIGYDNSGDSEGGSHYSLRLHCESDISL